MLRNFDNEKAEVFEESLGGEDKQRFNSLAALRNDVAHDRSINITINSVYEAFEAGGRILERLESVLSAA